jgi:hypothetical protein
MESAFEKVGEIAAVAPEVVEEAVEEMVGASPKKWAVALVAFAVGVGVTVGAIVLGKRRTAKSIGVRDIDAPVVPPAPAVVTEDANSSGPSTWSSSHPRMSRIESRLHVRRHTASANESEKAKP